MTVIVENGFSIADAGIIIITLSVCVCIAALVLIFVVCYFRRSRQRARRQRARGEETRDVETRGVETCGVENRNISLSNLAPSNENISPSHTTGLENYEQLVIDHVFKMHQELPPLEPSAPPLPP